MTREMHCEGQEKANHLYFSASFANQFRTRAWIDKHEGRLMLEVALEVFKEMKLDFQVVQNKTNSLGI